MILKHPHSLCLLDLSPLSWWCWKVDFCRGLGQGGFFSAAISLSHSVWTAKQIKMLPFYLWFWISSANPWLCAQQNPRAKFSDKHPVACLSYLSEEVQAQKKGREKCLVPCKQWFPLLHKCFNNALRAIGICEDVGGQSMSPLRL